jgi:ADP-ribose pyrophosphatase YjhB (NUDIX family)
MLRKRQRQDDECSHFSTFRGELLAGGAELAALLAEESLPSGCHWRLVVGNASAACRVAMTGAVLCQDGRELSVSHVINAAAAEWPYAELNVREDVQYANVVTRDWPTPTTESDERPCWERALALLDLSLRSSADVTLFVHCVYGLNRSVSTAALCLARAFPQRWPCYDAAHAHIASCKDTNVLPVYAQWAREELERHPPGLAAASPAELPPAPAHTGAAMLLLYDCCDEPSTHAGPYALLVRDHTGCFSPPAESRKAGEGAEQTAVRALLEEAHITGVQHECLADADLFARVDLGATGALVVFISHLRGTHARSPALPPATQLSRERFEAARAAVAGGCLPVGSALEDYLETTEMAHACVEDMVHPCFDASTGHRVVRDHLGQPLDALRPLLLEPILCDPRVRAVLAEELSAHRARLAAANDTC